MCGVLGLAAALDLSCVLPGVHAELGRRCGGAAAWGSDPVSLGGHPDTGNIFDTSSATAPVTLSGKPRLRGRASVGPISGAAHFPPEHAVISPQLCLGVEYSLRASRPHHPSVML